MSEIPKAYEPQSVEDKWYDFWQRNGCFTADPARVTDKRPAYSIVIPPPNVTGMLHMGHVLNNTIQDILARKARMDGKEVLWLPGTDHAGIATEGMVAKQLRKEEKKDKREIGREEFIKRVWQWKEKHGGIIISQLKKLGCSCDWTRERFTMDPDYVRNVQRVFVDLYKKGLIYRGKRMVNWCPATQTALSDEEVEMKSQKGFMYHFRVEVVEKDAAIAKGARPLLDDLLGKVTVVPELKATNRWEAIDELIDHLATAEKIQAADREAATAAIKKREYSMSTGIGYGIGIPHASSDLVKEVVAVLGHSKTGIAFDALDNQPVKLVMLFLVPHGEFQKHQHALANIAKLLHKQDFRQALEAYPESGNAGGPQIDSQGRVWLTIATTRPETIPADTAVAVNPKDPRYAHLIGKHVYRALPLDVPKEQRIIPIIADEHVDFEFGTGVLKVTPAHDKADFEIGQRHQLPVIDVLTPDAKMTAEAGADLVGLDRFVARKKAAEILEAAGTLEKAVPYENNVGFSQRAGVPIEPRLSEQWFLKYPAVEQAKACVEQEDCSGGVSAPSSAVTDRRYNKMRFHPQRWAKVYDHWLTYIQDWCISRQLWWGHRIPVWSKEATVPVGDCKPLPTTPLPNLLKWLVGDRKTTFSVLEDGKVVEWRWDRDGETAVLRCVYLSTITDQSKDSRGSGLPTHFRCKYEIACVDELTIRELEKNGFIQDPDVLDTWFSSWLWPFATMGWTGDKSQDSRTPTLQAFYPTTDLVTGPDIIFFWVARMIMAGYEYMGELPFRNVYFTGIIRDKQGRKMSKTLGNSPDPLVLIAKYGADALRFGTMRSAPLGQDVLFDEKDVELGRNFCNKLWNACRFRQMVGSATSEVQGEINPSLLTSDDKWILLKLHEAIREITEALNTYNFSTAVQALYRFFWSEYCDWYVEASKAVLVKQVTESNGLNQSGERTPPAHLTNLTSHSFNDSAARRANTLAVMDFVLSHTLRLFHPFLPFITEELWHGMGYSTDMPENQGGKTIMNAPWPKPFDLDFRDAYSLDECYLEFANQKYEVVTQGRNLRRVGNIQSGKKVKYVLKPSRDVLPHDAEVIKILLNAEALEINEGYVAKKGTPTAHTPFGELFLPLEGLVDVEAEKARLTKEKEKIEAEIVKVQQKLANPAFTQKVPPAVLQEHEQRLVDWKAKLEHVKAALDALNG